MNYYRMVYATETKEGLIRRITTHGAWTICTEKTWEEMNKIAEEYSERLNKEMQEYVKQLDKKKQKKYKNMKWLIYCNPEEVFTLEEFSYEELREEMRRL